MAVSVSAAVMYLGIQFGVEGTTGVFALLSLVLGFAGAVLTHAIIEILDILPETSFQRTSNFVDDSEKPSINQEDVYKRQDLLTELSNLERTVQDGLVRTAEERRMVDSARHLALLERLSLIHI